MTIGPLMIDMKQWTESAERKGRNKVVVSVQERKTKSFNETARRISQGQNRGYVKYSTFY